MSATAEARFAALHRDVAAKVGVRLFTVSALDRAARLARRAYSSHPVDYPVPGTKPLGDDGWSRMVIDRGETFVANDTAGFSPYFSDHAQINALGCHAAINIPISDGQQIVGTVNLLDAEGYFTPERVGQLQALVKSHRPHLLAALRSVPLVD